MKTPHDRNRKLEWECQAQGCQRVNLDMFLLFFCIIEYIIHIHRVKWFKTKSVEANTRFTFEMDEKHKNNEERGTGTETKYMCNIFIIQYDIPWQAKIYE